MGGSGAETLMVRIFDLPGNLQCDIEVTVSLVNGPKASMCFKNIFNTYQVTKLVFSFELYYHCFIYTVRGVDFDSVVPLTTTFSVGSVVGNTATVNITVFLMTKCWKDFIHSWL